MLFVECDQHEAEPGRKGLVRVSEGETEGAKVSRQAQYDTLWKKVEPKQSRRRSLLARSKIGQKPGKKESNDMK